MAQGTDAIRTEIDDTRDRMTDKMETIEDKAYHTRDEVQQSVQETVEHVKERFNLNRLVNERPWTMLGASIVAGYLLGNAGGSSRGRHDYDDYDDYDDDRDYRARRRYAARDRRFRYYEADNRPRNGDAEHDDDDASSYRYRAHSYEERGGGNSFVDDLSEQFAPEFEALKEAAIKTLTSTIHETLHETMPQLADEYEHARQEQRRRYQQGSDDSVVRKEGLDYPPVRPTAEDNDHASASRQASSTR